MFCENCGRLLNESDKFCQSCGKRVNRTETPLVEATNIKSEPLDENMIVQESVAVQELLENTESLPTLKPRKKWLRPVIIAAVLILLSSIIAYAAPVIKNMAQKLYYSPEDYFKVVVKREIKESTDEIGATLSAISDSNSIFGDAKERFEITLQAGDAFYDILEAANVNESDEIADKIDWIKKITLSGEASRVGTDISSDMKASINGKKILSLNTVVDNSGIYLDIPEINNKAIKIEFDSNDYYNNPFYAYKAFMDSSELQTLCEIFELIPDKEIIQNLLYKYICTAIDSVDTVSEDTEKLKAGDIKQSCTKLSVSVNEELLRKMLIAFMKEVRTDNEVKSIIRDFCELDAVDADFESVYSEMISGIDEIIHEAENTQGDREELVRFNVWVNNAGDLVGFGLEKDGVSFSSISLESGKDYSMKINAGAGFLSSVSLEGNGRVSGDRKSGTFYITAAGNKLAKIVSEYNTKDSKNGIFNGKISFELTDFVKEQVKSMVSGEIASMVSNLKLTLEFNTKPGESEYASVKLTKGSELCYLASAKSQLQSPSEKIDIPQNYISVGEESKMLDWLSGLNLNKLNKNLKSAGAPREITDAITQADEELQYYLQPETDIYDEYGY